MTFSVILMLLTFLLVNSMISRDSILLSGARATGRAPCYLVRRLRMFGIACFSRTHRSRSPLVFIRYLFRDTVVRSVSDRAAGGDRPNLSQVQGAFMNVRSLRNVSNFVFDLISSMSLPWMALCETWLTPDCTSVPALSTPAGYVFLHRPRLGRPGGGVAIICKSHYRPEMCPHGQYSTFELMVVRLWSPGVRVAVVYRPPGVCSSLFFEELGDLLIDLSVISDRYIVVGDFNVNMGDPGCREAVKLRGLLDIFSVSQYVHGSTHSAGGTLDLLLSPLSIVSLSVSNQSGIISDHFLLHFTFGLPEVVRERRRVETVVSRNLSAVDVDRLGEDLLNGLPAVGDLPESVDDALSALAGAMEAAIDVSAPLMTRHLRLRPNCEWYNSDLRVLKRRRRACERRLWRARSRGLPTGRIELEFRVSTGLYRDALEAARVSHSLDVVEENRGDPGVVYRLLGKLLRPSSSDDGGSLEPAEFLVHFNRKVDLIRSSILVQHVPDTDPTVAPVILDVLELTNAEELHRLILASKKSNCPLDTFPTQLYSSQQLIHILLPYLVYIFNLSLQSGVVPLAFKRAAVRPKPKTLNLDLSDPSNFRPISHLSFLSKTLERVVSSRLTEHLSSHGMDDVFQSGFKPLHSTETALLRVTDDLRRAAGRGCVSFLVLLDLTAAFDTVDHAVLIERLSTCVGLSGTALSWFRSYLSGRSMSVYVGANNSAESQVHYGVPQGSVLGPSLFLIYLLPLGALLRRLGASYHFYADDAQIYITSSDSSLDTTVEEIETIYSSISSWLSNNFLKLNHSKTEIAVIGTPSRVSRALSLVDGLGLGDARVRFSSVVKNLGVSYDSSLSFKEHIQSKAKKCLILLKNLKQIRSHFNDKAFSMLIHSLIFSHVDYCNSLFAGLPSSTLRPLQLVQNYAARLLLRVPKYSHIKPILRDLHWLPVGERVEYKILLFVFKALNSLSPLYLSELLIPSNRPSYLRNLNPYSLYVPRTFLRTMDDRAFSVTGPLLWNGLPLEIRTSPSLEIFKTKLKTFLYNKVFN